ncbi:efflux RND transporter periplasmic adaptor subunit [Vibrio paucivorans]|uniref:Efflux RND transporter periplasmic adaptor subunit n=1 Tax=Vibrio paucivorans TaxID=2829489 RepID=A0A9X3CDG1_9VIBR|nr:efflux RND transporter periplasmic adaptor subunit [Vibrio paucivorans]MCW8333637.1 efflux RND transporter periplasmic adaptor subunit [Vibrio paucivorans]
MNITIKVLFPIVNLIMLISTPVSANQVNDDHSIELTSSIEISEEETDHSEDNTNYIVLTKEQIEVANIQTTQVDEQPFNLGNVATATVIPDRDNTVVITPQIDIQILQRKVGLGQRVTKGDVLLTLGGSSVAQAQADYVTAQSEWDRVRSMGPNTVSASRRIQAQVAVELTRAILESIGMTPKQIKTLADKPEAIGSYDLIAPIDARVQQDIAQIGQVVTAATPLMLLIDESRLQVVAELTPTQTEQISIGSKIILEFDDTKRIEGSIVGRSHSIDTITRTEQVWAEFSNVEPAIHIGQFAEMYLPNAEKTNGIILPDAALTRGQDGDWQVFLASSEGFQPQEVDIIDSQNGMNLIYGLKQGTEVVVEGAFFLASEQAKSGFDIHAH